MRHLFYIHSHITHIVSVSAISSLHLNPEDVVFIFGRGFTSQTDSEIDTIHLPESLMSLSSLPSYGKRFIFFKKYCEIIELDTLVTNLVQGNKFIAYLPLTTNFLMQLLATHSQCNDLVFIEEGLLTYAARFDKKTRTHFTDTIWGTISKLLKYPNHGNRTFFYRRYPYTRPTPLLVLHDAVDDRDADIAVQVLQSVIVPPVDPRFRIDGRYIFIVDTVVEEGIISLESFIQVIQFFITKCVNDKQNAVWLRFRPHHPISDQIIDLFETRSIQVNILPDNVSMESVLYHCTDLTVAGLHSSLLFYAAIWGQKSYSLLEKLFTIDGKAEARYRTYVHFPKAFYDQVNML